MKTRPKGFLSEDNIDHNSEIFDYIRELHVYLWEFVRTVDPSANGNLNDYIDKALRVARDELFGRTVHLMDKL